MHWTGSWLLPYFQNLDILCGEDKAPLLTPICHRTYRTSLSANKAAPG